MANVVTDAVTNRAYKDIVYHLQTKLQMELPEDIKHDILSNVERATGYYKGLYEEHRNTTIQFNSLMTQLKAAGIYKNWINQ
jgi:hypothetical protein